jgi:hypothetical protein
MRKLKSAFQTVIAGLMAVWTLPRLIARTFEQRRQQSALDELEAERLDRIRNPSKYLGK